MDLIYTDSNLVDIGTLDGCEFDLAFGADENDFEVKFSIEDTIPDYGSLVYIEGTEYGGIVSVKNPDTLQGTILVGGLTWHGLLESRVLGPDAGQDYLIVSGDLNTILGQLITRMGLGDTFQASATASGITVSNYSFTGRYVPAYSGIKEMCASVGAKLKMVYSGSKVVLWAELIHDYSTDEEFDSDQINLAIKADYRPVNHLVCLGSGELKDRIRVDLYASEDGTISTTQTLFGLDERQEQYEYTSADAESLVVDGTKKLQEYQDAAVSVTVDIDPTDTEFDIGDIVGGRENRTGIFVATTVTKKIVSIVNGMVLIEYQTGEAVGLSFTRTKTPTSNEVLAAINAAMSVAGIAQSAQKTATTAAGTATTALTTANSKSKTIYATTWPDPPYNKGDILVLTQGGVTTEYRANTTREA